MFYQVSSPASYDFFRDKNTELTRDSLFLSATDDYLSAEVISLDIGNSLVKYSLLGDTVIQNVTSNPLILAA